MISLDYISFRPIDDSVISVEVPSLLYMSQRTKQAILDDLHELLAIAVSMT